VLLATTLAVAGAGIALDLAARLASDRVTDDVATIVAFALGFPVTPTLGWLLARRRPTNPVGWILGGAALAIALSTLASGYGQYGAVARPGSLPWTPEIAWLAWAGLLGFALPASLLLLVFPDGELLTAKWRIAVWTAVVGMVFVSIGTAVRQGPIADVPAVMNPLGLAGPVPSVVEGVGFVAVLSAFFAGAASLVLRYRRATAIVRQQLKLLAFVGVVLFVLVAVMNAVPGAHDTWLWPAHIVVLLVALPTAIAVSVLRYRLYDIDRLVRRSVVYGVLWSLITAVYVATAAGLGVEAGHRLPVSVAVLVTIMVTLVFQPLRRRLEVVANRVVFGHRPTAAEVLDELGTTLRHELDIAELGPHLAVTVRRGLDLEWARVALYLADGDHRRLEPIGVDGVGADTFAPPVVRAVMVSGDEELGEIECGPKQDGMFAEDDQRLLETLAGQAALAVRNARLATELSARLDEIARQAAELSASRARIVAAQDAERRRIERNIHDGAQQELAALMVKLRRARNQLRDDPTQADRTLTELQDETRLVLAGLRELAQGIHPSVLTDKGLVEAIEAQAVRFPLALTLDATGTARTARWSDETEAAAYFVFSEALANVLKHARANAVTVRVMVEGSQLHVAVLDDGIGFDTNASPGSGMAHLADRVAAMGGTLRVESAPGHGCTVSASIPVRLREATNG
jgi:signal transduction histidine kinase